MTMGAVQADGVPLRDHVAQIERQTGKTPKEFIFPDCPPALRYVWKMFLEASRSRANTGYGFLPLGYAEILAWSQLMQCDVTPFEVALLRRLDALYMQNMQKNARQ